MTKKLSFFLLFGALALIIAAGVDARSRFDDQPGATGGRSQETELRQYNLQPTAAERLLGIDPETRRGSQGAPERRALGSSSTTAGSSGVPVDNSWRDWQWSFSGHKVQWRKQPWMQFTYVDRQMGTGGTNKFGYNVYNPIGGTWPRGAVTGCQIQPSSPDDLLGVEPNIGVFSRGRVVIGGYDDFFHSQVDIENAIYFQSNSAGAFNCTWGFGTRIDSSQYKLGMIDYDDRVDGTNGSRLAPILLDVQEWGIDTITHVLGLQSDYPYMVPGTPVGDTINQTPLLYFRKMTYGNTGTWVGPTVLDTIDVIGAITASRTSPKLAVIYIKTTAAGISQGNGNDCAVYYRESDSIGTTWNPKVNITPYNRSTEASYTPWVEAKGIYDSNQKLHIIFNGIPVPVDPYNNTDYDWNSLYNGSSVLHWTNATNVMSRIHNAEWDLVEAFPASTVMCGLLGTNMLTTGGLAISECNGLLYVVWVMANNPNANPPLLNDCVSGGVRDWRFRGNGEIYLSVSSDLDGLLWDAARNLTRSPSPGCDSTGFGGVCYSDAKPTMSNLGMDITSFDTNGFPVTLTWPDTGVNPGPGAYTGNYYTHVFFVEDHWAGFKSVENAGNTPQGFYTQNPLKWMRLACVAPIAAPQIDWTPKTFGYAEKQWTKHGKADTTVITVRNDGNATLNVTTVGMSKTTQTGVDWLGVSAPSLTVNAGVGNTSTFSLFINKNGVVNTPNTIVALTGEVYLLSNVAEPRDSVSIKITNFLVADTLVDLKWDTLTTSCTRLIVSNSGDIGRMGQGGVNLDYSVAGGECVNGANVYAYDGGPIVIRKSGTTYKFSSAIHQGDFTTEQAFKPYSLGSGPSTISSPGVYDGFFTGTFVNRDTTIGVRRTYYAPTVGNDTCNFVIQKSVFFGIGGPKTNVTLGEAIDWDIPSMTGSNNDGRVLTSKSIVYQQGNDTLPTSTRCIPHYNRFGTIAFLGMYTPAEKALDSCANDANMYGAYTMLNDTLFKYDTMSNTNEGAYFWNQMGALSGLTAAPFQGKDLHMVMTYKHDLASLDTLIAYSAVISVKNGDTSVLKTGIDKAKGWFFDHLRPGCGSCCLALSGDGRTGNVDADPDKGVDISDLSALIDFLYISFTVPQCMLTANTDGDPDNGVDISDLSALIDFLYISFTPPAPCH